MNVEHLVSHLILGEQKFNVVQEYRLTGEPAIDSTQSSPKLGLYSRFDVGSSVLAIRSTHHSHS